MLTTWYHYGIIITEVIMLANQNDFKVYAHTNKINGKKYIGITCQPVEQRWKRGNGYKNCTAFEAAIKKYGWGGFKHEVLFSGLNSEAAKAKERELILIFHTTETKHGYNLTSGGDSGAHLSNETKKRHSEALLGHKESKETRKKISNAHIGKTISEEAKIKIAQSLKGKFVGDKNPMYGKSPSTDTLKKLREASKRFWVNEEYRKNHCEMSKSLWKKEGYREKCKKRTRGNAMECMEEHIARKRAKK